MKETIANESPRRRMAAGSEQLEWHLPRHSCWRAAMRRKAGATSVAPCGGEAPSSMAAPTSASTSRCDDGGQGRDHVPRLQHKGIGRGRRVPGAEASRHRG